MGIWDTAKSIYDSVPSKGKIAKNFVEYGKGVGEGLVNATVGAVKEGAYGVYDFGQVAVGGTKVLAKEGLSAVGLNKAARAIEIKDLEPMSALGKLTSEHGVSGAVAALKDAPGKIYDKAKDVLQNGTPRDMGNIVGGALVLPAGVSSAPAKVAVVVAAQTGKVLAKGTAAAKATAGAVKDKVSAAIGGAKNTKTPAGTNSANQPCPLAQEAANADTKPGANKQGEASPEDNVCSTAGCPISLVTGEEILTLTDFNFTGHMPLAWSRTYKSSNPEDIGLGVGWTHPFAESLRIKGNYIEYHTHEARIIKFDFISAGQSQTRADEGFTLKHLEAGRFEITRGQISRLFEVVSDKLAVLSMIYNRQGHGYKVNYQDGNLSQITSNTGEVWQLQYQNNHLHSIQLHQDEQEPLTLVSYRYNDQDDLIQAIDPEGHSERYAYEHHLIKQRTLKSGYSFHFAWSGRTHAARCIHNWGDPIDGQATYDYHFAWGNREVTVTDTRGGQETHRFNQAGLPIYVRDAEGGETHYRYNSAGKLIEHTDPQGNVKQYHYNNQHQLISLVDESQYTRHYQWQDDLLVGYTDAQGQHWTRQYNEQQLLSQETNPLGQSTQYQYNEFGQPSLITLADGTKWQYLWDDKGQLQAKKDPLGNTTLYSYNAKRQLAKITWADGSQSSYVYDNNGRCIQRTSPDGQVEHYAYSPLGQLSKISDQSGRTTQYFYNGLSQVVKRIDPNGQTLHYQYDGERNLIGLRNELGEQYQLKYDLNERLIEEIGFDGRTQRYAYSKNGHLVQSLELDEQGNPFNTLHYQRDAQGRLLKQQSEQGVLAEYQYNPLGQLIEASTPARQLRWEYDALGRVTQDWQDDYCLTHEYLANGLRKQTQANQGYAIGYGYDELGRFNSLSCQGHQLTAIQYDAMGREIHRALDNHTSYSQQFDPQGRLVKQQLSKQSSLLNQRQYHYDDNGRISQINDNLRGAQQFKYDSLDRLTSVEGFAPEKFIHDPAGNLLDNASQRLQGNKQTQYQGQYYKYDRQGNRVASHNGKQQTNYQYNELNQLVAVTNGKVQASYAYDALGRRTAKTVNGKVTQFYWDGDVLQQERSPETTKTYLFEPNSFKPFAFIQNGHAYYYHLDHLGTPQEITNDQGKIVWGVKYRVYGNVVVTLANEVENNLRFQGQYFDQETGLHYNRFRYYDPHCGRFINQDPIGLLGGLNNYQYVPNPLGWVDPFGLTAKDCGGTGGVTVQNDGYATWVRSNNDPNALVRIEDTYKGPTVTDIYSGNLPAGSGSDLLSIGLKNTGIGSGDTFRYGNIINPETKAAFEQGMTASDSKLGKVANKALQKMGLEAKSMDFVMERGKLMMDIKVR